MAVVNLDWRKGLAELLIIVTGVMIALAADRWRESQRDERLTVSYLERLKSDVEADIAAFETTVAWAGAIDESCLYVLDVYRVKNPPAETADLFAYHLFRASWNMRGHTVSGTYQDLVSTGNFGLLPVHLRPQVTDYYAVRDYYVLDRIESFADDARTGYWRVPDVVLGPVLAPEIWRRIQGTAPDYRPTTRGELLSEAGLGDAVRKLREIDDLETSLSVVRRQMAQRQVIFGERLPQAARTLLQQLEVGSATAPQ